MRFLGLAPFVDPDLDVVHVHGLALEDLIEHGADRVPGFRPNLVAWQAESCRVLAAEDWDEGVVVEPDAFRSPGNKHGLSRIQDQVDKCFQFNRPGCSGSNGGLAPLERRDTASHFAGTATRSPRSDLIGCCQDIPQISNRT